MATAGADYGMALLWTVFLSCVITFFLIDLYGRFTLVTGETALGAFRRHIHPAVGIVAGRHVVAVSQRDASALDYRMIVLAISLLGLIVPILGARPMTVMIVSQAFGALVLPVTVACLIYIGRSLMREHAFGAVTNTLPALTLAFALTMSWMSYAGLLATLRTLG